MMFPPVNTNDPAAVEAEVRAAFLAMFPTADPQFVARAFGWMTQCFAGHYRDYQPIDAAYHDLEHTLQGTLCMARLLQGRHLASATPALPQRVVELGLLAILFHDTGYLKRRGDTDGTGAKYTVTHVARSMEFAAEFLGGVGFAAPDVRAVQNMIRCTGVDAALNAIPFQSEPERIAGHALGTADLLGQMAADDYVDKLPILYDEFAEAAGFTKDQSSFVARFSNSEDLMQKTPAFWENYVKVKLDREFGGLYRFLNEPYPGGPNFYLDRVEANVERLRQLLAAKG